MCDHNDSALPWHFIEAPDKSPLHKIISDNRRLFTGRALTKGSQILAIGTGPNQRRFVNATLRVLPVNSETHPHSN